MMKKSRYWAETPFRSGTLKCVAHCWDDRRKVVRPHLDDCILVVLLPKSRAFLHFHEDPAGLFPAMTTDGDSQVGTLTIGVQCSTWNGSRSMLVGAFHVERTVDRPPHSRPSW